jgi:hypothetical protein
MSKVIDLSDLVEDVEFKVKDAHYRIPAFNDKQMKEITRIANEISGLLKGSDEEKLENNTEYLDKQNQILEKTVLRKDGNALTKDELEEWPIKLKSKVTELVFDSIGASSGKNVTEEQEKN